MEGPISRTASISANGQDIRRADLRRASIGGLPQLNYQWDEGTQRFDLCADVSDRHEEYRLSQNNQRQGADFRA